MDLGEFLRGQGLTEKQAEVAKLLCDGLSDKQVADRIGIKASSVSTRHVPDIFKKMRVQSRAQLMVKCWRHCPDHHGRKMLRANLETVNENIWASRSMPVRGFPFVELTLPIGVVG